MKKKIFTLLVYIIVFITFIGIFNSHDLLINNKFNDNNKLDSSEIYRYLEQNKGHTLQHGTRNVTFGNRI